MTKKRTETIDHIDKHPLVVDALADLKTLSDRRSEVERQIAEALQKPDDDAHVSALMANPNATICEAATSTEVKKLRIKHATLDKACHAQSARVGDCRRAASIKILEPIRKQRAKDIIELHRMLKPIIEFCLVGWHEAGALRQSGASGWEDLRHLGPAPGNPQEWLKRWEERHKDFLE